MRIFTLYFKFLFIFLLVMLANGLVLYAQNENRLPSNEEIDEKVSRFNSWEWWGKVPTGIQAEKYYNEFLKNGGLLPSVFITGAEQQCDNAIVVCSSSYSQSSSYSGVGTSNEVSTSSCLGTGETNSVWYVFTVQSNGNFGFTLDVNASTDYDFALYNITSIGCSGVPTATPDRCNYSATKGNTGMSVAGICATCGASQGSFCTELAVTAGQTYALIINNYSGDVNGYTLDFNTGGGYASITDATAPAFGSASASCTSNQITLTMSEQIKCSSFALSDFQLWNSGETVNHTAKLTSVSGSGCTSPAGNSLSSQLVFTHDGTLASGSYIIKVINTNVKDKCNNALASNSTVSFNYLAPFTLTPSSASICSAGNVNLDVASGPPSTTVSINPGSLSNTTNAGGEYTFSSVNVNSTTTFTASITYGGCTRTATATVTVATPTVSVSPVNPQICSGTTTLTAAPVNCSGCTYAWSTGETTSSVVKGSGTYTVTVTASGGCSATASSTVSLASAGAGTNCNVYYVSPNGGGTGLTKSSPTTLQNALSASLCTNALIKMQVGVYSISDRISVNSYVTIEGGFNSGFTTKTSNISGGSSSTTIRRTAGPDSDDATSCSAFKVVGGSSDFRFQDLRIEMPGSTNISQYGGSGVSNYGIKMGAACTSYQIVRCYIDAGTAQ